jgi:hypothetical protein
MKHDNKLNSTMLYAFRKAIANRHANEEISHTVREIIGNATR